MAAVHSMHMRFFMCTGVQKPIKQVLKSITEDIVFRPCKVQNQPSALELHRSKIDHSHLHVSTVLNASRLSKVNVTIDTNKTREELMDDLQHCIFHSTFWVCGIFFFFLFFSHLQPRNTWNVYHTSRTAFHIICRCSSSVFASFQPCIQSLDWSLVCNDTIVVLMGKVSKQDSAMTHNGIEMQQVQKRKWMKWTRVSDWLTLALSSSLMDRSTISLVRVIPAAFSMQPTLLFTSSSQLHIRFNVWKCILKIRILYYTPLQISFHEQRKQHQ